MSHKPRTLRPPRPLSNFRSRITTLTVSVATVCVAFLGLTLMLSAMATASSREFQNADTFSESVHTFLDDAKFPGTSNAVYGYLSRRNPFDYSAYLGFYNGALDAHQGKWGIPAYTDKQLLAALHDYLPARRGTTQVVKTTRTQYLVTVLPLQVKATSPAPSCWSKTATLACGNPSNSSGCTVASQLFRSSCSISAPESWPGSCWVRWNRW